MKPLASIPAAHKAVLGVCTKPGCTRPMYPGSKAACASHLLRDRRRKRRAPQPSRRQSRRTGRRPLFPDSQLVSSHSSHQEPSCA